MEPFRSAKSTVTCLRSPAIALRKVRIFSARCRGVYASGEAKRVCPVRWASTLNPHAPQNRTPSASSAPQDAQERARRAPHSVQKRDDAGSSWRQRGQGMADLSRSSPAGVRTTVRQ